MTTHFTWLSEDNPLPTLERKWQGAGALSAQEMQSLHEQRCQNPDVRVRESCRILLAAINGNTGGEPHAQHLVRLRNLAIFRSKVRGPQAVA